MLFNDHITQYLDDVEHLLSQVTNPREVTYVHNISDHLLSEAEISLLNKGLKFCPTPPQPDIGLLVKDIEHFFRTANIKLFFSNSEKKDSLSNTAPLTQTISQTHNAVSPLDAFQHKDLKLRSTWNPPVPPLLEHVKQLILSDIQNFPAKVQRHRNLSSAEYKSINSLFKNDNIVIKPADKGSGIVILNKDDYIKEGERQLADTTFYKSIDSDLTQTHLGQIKEVVDKMLADEEITEKTHRYLITNCDRTPEFYLLPKIHKSLVNPPGRPIISGNDSPTEKISHLVDIILQPFVPNIKSYVKDTTDFLNKVGNINLTGKSDVIICTLDVTSLYTNIPHKEGIQVIKNLLNSERPNVHNPSNDSVIKLLDFVLTKNSFQFNGKNYLQINGTAMGTRVAPTYANLFMSDFEDKYVYTYHKPPYIWLRYIDDVFMVWLHGLTELLKFIDHLNSSQQHIKFTHEHSRIKVNYLDTTVKYTEGKGLSCNVYSKPTDTQSYLRYNSCHPSHIRDSLPYSQLLRLRRICTDHKDYVKNSLKMIRAFHDRGYPLSNLLDKFYQVLELDRNSLLEKVTSSDESDTSNNLFCIIEYNPSNPPIKDIIQKHWPILGRSSSTRSLVESKIIFGFRRPPNLRDKLIRARLRTSTPDEQESWPQCKKPEKCKQCPRINKSGHIISHSTKRKFKCVFNPCCQSRNLIYCLTCKICGFQYVGQTITPIKTRVNNHLSTIRTNKDTPVAQHMRKHDQANWFDLEVFILEYIKSPAKSHRAKQTRDQKERDWMARLNTLVPHGMNIQD